MVVFVYIFLFLIGVCLGSFLLCILQRIHFKKKWMLSRSTCDHCLKKIYAYDLVPFLSFCLLKGKCRFCKAQLRWYEPLGELLLGLLFIFSFWHHLVYSTSKIYFIGVLFLITILFCIAFYDALYKLVLSSTILIGCLAGLLFHIKIELKKILSQL